MKKKFAVLTLCFAVVLGLAACGGGGDGGEKENSGSAGGDPIKLKLSISGPETSTWNDGALEFKKIVEEKTDGKFEIEVYPNDQLSGGNQVGGIEMLQQGVTDLHMQDALLWSSIDPKIGAVAFPWLLSTYEQVDSVMEGEGGEALADMVSNSGAVCLGIGENGYREIVNIKHEIKTPEDLKGLKIRVPGIDMYVNMFKTLGADPVSMNQSEVYTSLQQGALDGCENTMDLLLSQNTCEVVNYLTAWNYSYDPLFFCASTKLWDTLSDDEKTIFLDAGKAAMAKQKEVARKVNEDGYSKLGDYDLTVTELTDEQVQAFKEAVKPVYEQYRDIIGEETFAKFGYTF